VQWQTSRSLFASPKSNSLKNPPSQIVGAVVATRASARPVAEAPTLPWRSWSQLTCGAPALAYGAPCARKPFAYASTERGRAPPWSPHCRSSPSIHHRMIGHQTTPPSIYRRTSGLRHGAPLLLRGWRGYPGYSACAWARPNSASTTLLPHTGAGFRLPLSSGNSRVSTRSRVNPCSCVTRERTTTTPTNIANLNVGVASRASPALTISM
jgi:hypothetical protein